MNVDCADGSPGAALPLSIVVPLHNEVAIVEELARRCAEAARQTELAFEVVLVDDGSSDGTGKALSALEPAYQVRLLELPINQGQFVATRRGLGSARGATVVVLDGDLQDPPELIPELVAAHLARLASGAATSPVTFAVKRSRVDPLWFRAGRGVFMALQRLVGGRAVPTGAGSYCAMTAQVAAQVAALPLNSANLASLLVARWGAGAGAVVAYDKSERYDGRSRVGPVGLGKEALSSLFLISPLGRRWLERTERQ